MWRLARGTASRLVLPVLLASHAQAGERVSIEIVLAVDVSLSVNDLEYALQKQGLADSFRDPEIGALIAAHEHGVAVAVIEWSGTYEADQPLPWTVLRTAADARLYAASILSAPRTELGSFTGLGHAISFSNHLIETNAYEGDEKKIDVSGDGRNNTGPEPRDTREHALLAGITVNGLAIAGDDPGLASYYASNVVAGPGAFVVVARDFEDFADALRRKLKRELSPRIVRRGPPAVMVAK